MASLGTTPLRRGKVSYWLAGITAVSLCTLAGAQLAPHASAAGASGAFAAHHIGAESAILPDGRPVRPAGIQYNLGDFSLGIAISPDGRCAASSDEGWGNGRDRPCPGSTARAPSRTKA
jgi:hypothetical protein